MSKKDGRLYLAHVSDTPQVARLDASMPKNGTNLEPEPTLPQETALYIADLLSELERMAAETGLEKLADLLLKAAQEAQARSSPMACN